MSDDSMPRRLASEKGDLQAEVAEPGVELRFGAFRLSRPDYVLRRDGESAALPLMPARLLFFLAERSGRIVSRRQIQEALWESTPVGVDAAINTCIRQVRKALGESAAEPVFLETFPRRGYRFNGPVETVRSSNSRDVPSPPLDEPRRRPGLSLFLCCFGALLGGFAVYRTTRPGIEAESSLQSSSNSVMRSSCSGL